MSKLLKPLLSIAFPLANTKKIDDLVVQIKSNQFTKINNKQLNIPLYIDLISNLVNKELKVRYKYSILGYLWALLNPLMFAVIYYFAFKIILRIQMENYSVFLLCGMFPWVFLGNALGRTTKCYTDNVSIIKNTKVNLTALPLSIVIQEGIHYVFSLPILLIFVIVISDKIFISWLYQIPLLFVLQIIFLYSLTQITSIANVFIRDIDYLVTISISLLFFLTPIIYSMDMIPEKYHLFYYLSPFTALIETWRSIFLNGQIPMHSIFNLFLTIIILSFFAFFIYRVQNYKIRELV